MSDAIPSTWIDNGFTLHRRGELGERHAYWSIEGRDCMIWIDTRPAYRDRGNYLARLEVRDSLKVHIDGADLWPRYYFDLERAKLECEAWLRKRNQWVD